MGEYEICDELTLRKLWRLILLAAGGRTNSATIIAPDLQSSKLFGKQILDIAYHFYYKALELAVWQIGPHTIPGNWMIPKCCQLIWLSTCFYRHSHTHTQRRTLSSGIFKIVPNAHPHASPTPTAGKKTARKNYKNEKRAPNLCVNRCDNSANKNTWKSQPKMRRTQKKTWNDYTFFLLWAHLSQVRNSTI